MKNCGNLPILAGIIVIKLDQNSLNEIARQAKVELARRHYADYVELVHHGKYKHFRHTRLICEHLQRIVDGEQLHLMIEMPPRSGKLCADSTPVYTPNGWTTHGQLQVGSYVYHPSGRPIKVIGVSDKHNADYVVTFANGEKIRVHGRHEWTVYNRHKQKYETLETQDLIECRANNGRCKYLLPNINALENTEKDLPIDPYTLGVWLGDGTATKPCITYDKRDYAMIQKIVDNGYRVSVTHFHNTTGVPTTYFSGARHEQGRLTTELKDNNLMNNKHIPNIFLKGSIEQRLQLLAGLIDSDGSTDKQSRISFSTTNERLKEDVYQLALSLGFRPYMRVDEPKLSSSGIQGRKKVYVIGFNPTIDIPTQLERKRPNRLIKQRKIAITSVKYKPNGEQGHCITVNSDDGLYLVGNKLIPTHNSLTVTETFPSYFIGRNPDKRVIASAYSDGLARKFGRLNRNKFAEFGKTLFDKDLSSDNSSTSNWGVSGLKGGMIATGIGGSITGEGADCFVAGTMIQTDKGLMDIKDIHECESNPLVLSYNHEKNEVEYKPIKATRRKKANEFTRITATGGNEIVCTKEHRVYDNQHGYKQAHFFRSGDNVTVYQSYIKNDAVRSVENITHHDTYVYDIQVEDNHNFFANGILVHNCLLIDDPIKNAKEALSTTIRENIWNEWESTLSTRLHDGASVIVVMTRWHEDDLIGRLLERSPYNWIRLRLPAIAEEDNDLIGRNIGDALVPELGFDEEWAKNKRIEVGERTWTSLYQQRPAPESGAIFKREWINKVDAAPLQYDDILTSWDFSFKGTKESDFVAGQVWVRKGSDFYLIDQVRARYDFTQSIKATERIQVKHSNCRKILVEDKANGPAIINSLKSKISGIIPITPRESKEARAYAVTPFFEAGNVHIVKDVPHADEFIEELVSMPNGLHDDTVDACTQALNYFANKKAADVFSINAW